MSFLVYLLLSKASDKYCVLMLKKIVGNFLYYLKKQLPV